MFFFPSRVNCSFAAALIPIVRREALHPLPSTHLLAVFSAQQQEPPEAATAAAADVQNLNKRPRSGAGEAGMVIK